ncbi:MAG: hypothetical protein Q4F63_02955 [Clostridia bacterium]|nr:hypothetical protein [Clostridia bacterium]
MKKHIAILAAAVALAGCGGESKENDIATTTETEITTEDTTVGEYEEMIESGEEETDEAETKEKNQNADDDSKSQTVGETVSQSVDFEESSAYKELESLAANAGFEMSYSDGNVTFKKYITDDILDYIKNKDPEYFSKWDENCGLYEEFASEAKRNLNENNISDVNVTVEAVGASDNQVYYRGENGVSVYNAYN